MHCFLSMFARMEFFPKALQKYTENHTDTETCLLHQINRETHLHALNPRMLSGHLQGRVLSMLSHMVQPGFILEIGTYTGYATICLAEGLKKDGKIVTIDNNRELAAHAQSYFDASDYADQIEMKTGDAMEILPTLPYQWNLVFIDADKSNYSNYYDLVIEQTEPGGFIVADNVLWSGKVFDPSCQDKDTVSIREFNKKIHDDPGVQNVLFPIRDGLMVIRKK